MLIKDEGCVSEQSILRYQTNNIAELMECGWYGILLLSPKGKLIIDTCYNEKDVDENNVLKIIGHFITEQYLSEGACQCFDEQDEHILVYPIRKNEKDYYIFFVFYKKGAKFDEKAVMWYETYATTAHQRVLLENELAQDNNLLNCIFENTDEYVAIINDKYDILKASCNMGDLIETNLLDSDIEYKNEIALYIKNVMNEGSIKKITQTKFRKSEDGDRLFDISIFPFRSGKGVIGAAIIIAK